MKFFAMIFALFAFVTLVASDDVRPTPPRRCDYKCTKLDGTICATNGICQHLFPSQCLLNKYNCLFPQKAFRQIQDWKCHESALPQCSKAEL